MKCLKCSQPVDKKTNPKKDRIVICTKCATIMQLNDDLKTLRIVDHETFQQLMKDEEIQRLIIAITKTTKETVVHHTDLRTGKKYFIHGEQYTYDGYSTFWNLRMIDNAGKLHIFDKKKTIINSYEGHQH